MPHVLVPTCARARGNLEGNLGQMELHDDSSNLSRIHLDRFLPSLLGWIRTARTPLIVWHAVRVMKTSLESTNGCRARTCTFTRWKCMGWTSIVRLAICQTSTVPSFGVSVVGSTYARA